MHSIAGYTPSTLSSNGTAAGGGPPYSISFPTKGLPASISSSFGVTSERSEPDNCDLLQLSEATLLHNTLLRYRRDEIYTFTCAAPSRRPPRHPSAQAAFRGA